MNLLELIEQYQAAVRRRGRNAADMQLKKSGISKKIRREIKACFASNGDPLNGLNELADYTFSCVL